MTDLLGPVRRFHPTRRAGIGTNGSPVGRTGREDDVFFPGADVLFCAVEGCSRPIDVHRLTPSLRWVGYCEGHAERADRMFGERL